MNFIGVYAFIKHSILTVWNYAFPKYTGKEKQSYGSRALHLMGAAAAIRQSGKQREQHPRLGSKQKTLSENTCAEASPYGGACWASLGWKGRLCTSCGQLSASHHQASLPVSLLAWDHDHTHIVTKYYPPAWRNWLFSLIFYDNFPFWTL